LNTTRKDFIEFINHILTICRIYEASSDKIGRVEVYAKQTLEKLESKKKGGIKATDAKRKRSKC
jgi:hypothetical protein